MSVQAARLEAESLAEGFTLRSLPVDVKAIAEELGLTVLYEDLGEDVAALLVTKGKHAYVFINNSDAPARQRFSIGHEVGHFVLGHQLEEGRHVHVDHGHFISQRGSRASGGFNPKEIEANQFAACLLMPEKLVREAVSQTAPSGPLLDHHVSRLAILFKVSEQAMTIRLTTLGLL